MLNKQVKLGSTVHFKHGGQPHTGEVMSTAPGPEPSGQPVTLAHIEPALQGHPTITLDASDLTLPPKKRPNLPDGPPFTAPDATFDGGPVSPRQFYLFSTYADAQRILDLELAAIAKQYPGALGVTAVISDDIYGSNGYPPSNSAFRMNSGPPSDPPVPNRRLHLGYQLGSRGNRHSASLAHDSGLHRACGWFRLCGRPG